MTYRFLVFAGHEYYADGGWCDFQCAKPTVETAITEAKRLFETAGLEWVQVIDSSRLQPVYSDGHAYGGHELQTAHNGDTPHES